MVWQISIFEKNPKFSGESLGLCNADGRTEEDNIDRTEEDSIDRTEEDTYWISS